MVKAQTTREQAAIAKQTGQALFAYACKSRGTVSMDGPISHCMAKYLTRLVGKIVTNEVSERTLQVFVEGLEKRHV